MKKLTQFCLLFFIMISAVAAQTRAELQKEIEKRLYFDAKVTFEKTPAFTIGVIVGDSSFIYHYGSLSKHEKILPTDTTLFEIGGATKVFTASLVELLVAEGLMHHDSLLNTYLPENTHNPTADNLRLIDVLTHTSGLPRMPTDIGSKELEIHNPYAYYTPQDLFAFYKNYNLTGSRAKEYIYSNVSYALMEKAIESVTQMDYQACLQQKLLAPIGLHHTYIELDKIQESNVAIGHSNSGQPIHIWKYQTFEGSVGLKSCARDLLQFLKVQMGQEYPTFSSVFANMHEAMFPTLIDKQSYAAKGWHIIKNRRYYDLIAHSGTTNGHRVFMGFVKETETAVVILANSKTGTNGLGYLILQMLNNNWKKARKRKR